MKKKSIKKAFNKKTSFALLLGVAASFSPLLVMGSCNVTTSQGDKDKSPGNGNNQNPDQSQDVLNKELQKLTYTALSDENFKNLTIADSTILDESVAEQLGFVMPETLKEYIEKTKEQAAQYVVKVSKTKGSLEVTYKYQKAGEEKEKTQKVTMVPYQDNDLSTILEKLKGYNSSGFSEKDWKNVSASGFDAPLISNSKTKNLQIKRIINYAWTLKENKNINAYIRKVKNEDTIKYIVVKTLEQGRKIVAIGDFVKVSPTPVVLSAIRDKLKNLDTIDGSYPIIASVTSPKLKNLEHARTTIVPEDPNNKFDWDAIKIYAPHSNRLPKAEELQDPAATTKGKIEVEKLKGEAALHWYITYIDKNNNPLTDEYISRIQSAAPLTKEVEKYDWKNAKVLKYGDIPSNLIIATKPVVSRIELKDENDVHTYKYFYTNTYDSKLALADTNAWRYYGQRINGDAEAWIASNADPKYFNEIRLLLGAFSNPSYEDFKNEKNDINVPVEVRYMEVQ